MLGVNARAFLFLGHRYAAKFGYSFLNILNGHNIYTYIILFTKRTSCPSVILYHERSRHYTNRSLSPSSLVVPQIRTNCGLLIYVCCDNHIECLAYHLDIHEFLIFICESHSIIHGVTLIPEFSSAFPFLCFRSLLFAHMFTLVHKT